MRGSVLTYCTHLPDTTLICNSQVVGVNLQGMRTGSTVVSIGVTVQHGSEIVEHGSKSLALNLDPRRT